MSNVPVNPLIDSQLVPPPPILDWRKAFKSPSQMQVTQKQFLIKGFLTPGITFLAGPSGHGKTWLALSIAKALFTGNDFLGHFSVPSKTTIIYLVPENTETAFKRRLDTMGLSDVADGFLCQTLTDGPAIFLNNVNLIAAVEELHPVIFLDTAVRFNTSKDENDSMQTAQGLGALIFGLLQHGAQAVVPCITVRRAL